MIKKLLSAIVGGFIVCVIAFSLLDAVSVPSEKKIMSKSVMLLGQRGQCSGVQIKAPSGHNYILSAGHCNITLDETGSVDVVLETGQTLKRHLVAEDTLSDLLLLEGIPNMEGLEVGQSLYRHQFIRTFTHGKGMLTYKTEGQVVQLLDVMIPLSVVGSEEEAASCVKMPKFKIQVIDLFGVFKVTICSLGVTESVSTAKTVGGSSGGMVVDRRGRVVGIVSAGDGDFSLFVTLGDIRHFLSAY